VRGQPRDRDIAAIPGSPPDLAALPPGCAFAPRCRFAADACRAALPPAEEIGPGRSAMCARLEAARPAAAAAAPA
jgi:peptide/nickel transport system ATP-binding protein